MGLIGASSRCCGPLPFRYVIFARNQPFQLVCLTTRGAISQTKGAKDDIVDLYKGAEPRNVYVQSLYEFNS
jgi:hypothetical protein